MSVSSDLAINLSHIMPPSATLELVTALNAAALSVAYPITGDATHIGFFAATAIVQPTAYTQTYSTAARTVPAATTHAITDSSTGAVSTTALAAMTGVDGTGSNAAPLTATKNAVATLAAEAELTKADILALKKVVNSIIDDLQSYGLLQ